MLLNETELMNNNDDKLRVQEFELFFSADRLRNFAKSRGKI